LSTDGSGNNTLNANTIKDGSATKTLATLSSSAVTLHNDVIFPAGHVLQVQYTSTSNQMTSDGSYVQLLDGGYLTITKIAGSNILLSWATQAGKGGGNSYTYGSKIQRSTASNFSSVTNLPASPQVAATTEPSGSVGYNGTTTTNYIGNWGHTTIDEGITNSAGTYYYRVQFQGSGTNVYTAIDAGVSTFMAMEIKA